MKLAELAEKPKLEKVVVDDELIVRAYGEPLEFWMYDRQDLPTFMQLAQIEEDQSQLENVMRDLVRDERGQKVLADDDVLPLPITIKVIEAMVKHLGNSLSQTTAN